MGWVDDLYGKTVGIDTSPFIYLIEEHRVYLDAVSEFFSVVDAGRITAVTSTVTLLEVLVQPFRRGADELASQYQQILLNSRGLSCVEVSSNIAEEAARLRASYNLRTPDAIQLATAIKTAGNPDSTYFLTNDSFLTSVPDINILVLDQLIQE